MQIHTIETQGGDPQVISARLPVLEQRLHGILLLLRVCERMREKVRVGEKKKGRGGGGKSEGDEERGGSGRVWGMRYKGGEGWKKEDRMRVKDRGKDEGDGEEVGEAS